MNKKMLLLVVLLTIIAGLGYTSYILTKDDGIPKEIPKIKLAEEKRTLLFLPHYLAIQLGFFDEQNIDVQFSTLKGAVCPLSYDVILTRSIPAMLTGPLIKEDPPVAFAQITTRDGAFLLARPSKGK
ncbi:MAG: hypothetical protein LRZ99_03740 [Desulfotomaculum sp.]|nr:hypothetical protein [Desulfotomaculum sp.]MCL0080896.1 hypothetical protein [Peptococcaceae bacterium]